MGNYSVTHKNHIKAITKTTKSKSSQCVNIQYQSTNIYISNTRYVLHSHPQSRPHHHSFPCIISLLYLHTTALCSWQPVTCSGKRATLSPTLEPCQAQLTSVLWDSQVTLSPTLEPSQAQFTCPVGQPSDPQPYSGARSSTAHI